MTKYLIDTLQRIGRYLSKSRNEPCIERKSDREGNLYWQIYDPVSGFHSSLSSEQEVRIWLDNRY